MGGSKPHKLFAGLLAAILACGALAMVIDPIQFGDTRAHPLRPETGDRDRTLGAGPFKLNRVDPETEGHQRPAEVDSRGCWADSPHAFGAHVTGWYEARPKFVLVVCGFPTAPGNRLAVEFSDPSGRAAEEIFPGPDPGKTWEPWHLAAPPGMVRFRIRALNAVGGARGWFAFTEPFAVRMPLDWQLLADVQLWCTTCLALALIGGPGLALFARGEGGVERLACCFIAGPLLLATLGLACWVLGGWLSPGLVARMGAAGLLLWLARELARGRLGRFAREPGMRATVAAASLMVGFGAAKANVSIGAPGELYSGAVSRSLEVGSHSDSRISYHAVQLVAHHLAPFGPEAAGYYGSWSFAARGPLSGLLAAPVVLAAGASVPREMPDQPWRPFDRQGFAAYRIAMMALASLAAWALFAVVAALTAPRWGLLAAGIGLFTPFFAHEIYFTWPKLVASGVALTSFLLVHRRRPGLGGVYLGIGYLFHPLVLLFVPFLLIESLRRGAAPGSPPWKRGLAPAALGMTVLAVVAAWQAAGRWAGAGNAQGVFFSYFTGANGQSATWTTWWSSRWQDWANTFIPFHLLAANSGDESLNSVYAPSPWWVRAGFLYWNTLPFALGLPALVLLAAAIGRMARRAPWVVINWFLAPSLWLIAYWGVSDTGIMLQCGQTLFLAVLTLGGWSLCQADALWREKAMALFLSPGVWLWRGMEILVMAFAATLLNGFPHAPAVFAVNDVLSLGAAIAALTAAMMTLRAGGRGSEFAPARS